MANLPIVDYSSPDVPLWALYGAEPNTDRFSTLFTSSFVASTILTSDWISTGILYASSVNVLNEISAPNLVVSTIDYQSLNVYVGLNAGEVPPAFGLDNQGAIGIGYRAGNTGQEGGAVAIGSDSGQLYQHTIAIAIGDRAGLYNQQLGAIAIGAAAASTTQGMQSIAIGYRAGNAIGRSQPANSICINATGDAVNNLESDSLVVAPIRNITYSGLSTLQYDPSTFEIFYTDAGERSTFSQIFTSTLSANTISTNAITASTINGLVPSAAAGVEGSVQYKNGIVLGGDANFVYDKNNLILSVKEVDVSTINASSISIFGYTGALTYSDSQFDTNFNMGASSNLTGPNFTAYPTNFSVGDLGNPCRSFSVAAASGGIAMDSLNTIGINSAAGINMIGGGEVTITAGAAMSLGAVDLMAINSLGGVEITGSLTTIAGTFGVAITGGGGVAVTGGGAVTVNGGLGVEVGGGGGVAIVGGGGLVVGSAGLDSAGVTVYGGAISGFAGVYTNQLTTSSIILQSPDVVLGLNASVAGTGVSIGQNAYANTAGISLGIDAGCNGVQVGTIAVGPGVGRFGTLSNYAVAIGSGAQSFGAGQYAIAIGSDSGSVSAQPARSIVISASGTPLTPATEDSCYIDPIRNYSDSNLSTLFYNPGTSEITYGTPTNPNIFNSLYTSSLSVSSFIFKGSNVAIGFDAQSNGVHSNGIAIGTAAQQESSGNNAIAIGNFAGKGNGPGSSYQGEKAIAIGLGAQSYGSGKDAIAIGGSAGESGIAYAQAANSIIINATGNFLNTSNTSTFIVAPIRNLSAVSTLYYNPSSCEITYGDPSAVAISSFVSLYTSSLFASSIRMNTSSIALGSGVIESPFAVLIGGNVSRSVQTGDAAVIIGYNGSALGTAGEGAVAIGATTQVSGSGSHAIAIGALSGVDNISGFPQPQKSIVLNATGAALTSPDSNTFIVKPIRNATQASTLSYNPTSGEITYGVGGGGGCNLFSTLFTSSIATSTITIGDSPSRALGIGYLSQNVGVIGDYATSYGYASGNCNIGRGAVAIGALAQAYGAGCNAIAIGYSAGNNTLVPQSSNSIIINATGSNLNNVNTGLYVAPIRYVLGVSTLSYDPTSSEISYNDGRFYQQLYTSSLAASTITSADGGVTSNLNIIGVSTINGLALNDLVNQSSFRQLFTSSITTSTITIGDSPSRALGIGYLSQNTGAVGNFATSYGYATGNCNVGTGAVSIGAYAQAYGAGSNAVALGYFAGYNAFSSQFSNSIVINATGTNLNSSNTGLYVAPIRNALGVSTLSYNPTTAEISYNDGRLYQQLYTSSLNASSITSADGGVTSNLTISGLSTINGLAIGNIINTNVFQQLFTSSLNASSITSSDGGVTTNLTITGLSSINGLAIGSLVNGNTFSTLFTSSIQFSTLTMGNTDSVALGFGARIASAGGGQSVAVGKQAGSNGQGLSATAIGSLAQGLGSGAYSVAIGNVAGYDGSVAQAGQSIVINASGTNLNAANTGFFVQPIRFVQSDISSISYNPTTKELTYNDGRLFPQLFASSLTVSTISGDGVNNYLKIFNVSTIQNSAATMGISGLSTINGLAIGSLVNGNTFSTLFTSSLNVSTISSADGSNNFLKIFNVSTIQNSSTNMGISGLSTINGRPVIASPKTYFSSSLISAENTNTTVVQMTNLSSIVGGAYQAIGQVNMLGVGRTTAASLTTVQLNVNGSFVATSYISYASTSIAVGNYYQTGTVSFAGVFTSAGASTSTNTISVSISGTGSVVSTVGGSLTVITNLT